MVGRRKPNTNEPVEPGDVLWVKTYGSWWPAQVFDENMVSEKKKPKKKLAGEVLVRLYGSYIFLYWHPGRYKTEFLNILEQNNGSYKEMFDTFLEQELSRVKSNQAKRKISESREQAKVEAPKDKKLKQIGVNKSQEVGRLGSGNKGKLLKITACVLRTRKVRGLSGSVEDVNTVQMNVNQSRTRDEATENKTTKPNGVRTGDMADNGDFAPHVFKTSTDLSLRRTKVMQSLGLVAPSDSPFRRIGVFHL